MARIKERFTLYKDAEEIVSFVHCAECIIATCYIFFINVGDFL